MFVRPYSASAFRTYSAADVLGDGFDYAKLKGQMILIGVESDNPDDLFATAAGEDSPRLIVTAERPWTTSSTAACWTAAAVVPR